MRVAAIDISTNSLHMIVVQIRSNWSFELVDREPESTRGKRPIAERAQ